MSSQRVHLWHQADFLKLWIGQTVSLFGSQIGSAALRFTAILMLGATPVQLGLLTAAGMLPTLLIGLLAGVWVDRLRRRPLLIAADLGRAVLLQSIPMAYGFGVLRIEHLYLVAVLVGALTIVFDTAYQAFLPAVVRRDQLVDGNSKLGMSDSLAEIAGSPVGGMLVQIISAPLAILFDALSFAGSALALWRIQAPEAAPDVAAQQPGIWHEVSTGLRAIQSDPLLRALLGSAITRSLAGGSIGALYDLYLLRVLHFTPALVGLTIGVGGVGALAGAFIAQPVVRKYGIGPALIGALLVSGIVSVLLPLAHGPITRAVPMLMAAQLADVALALYFINELSLRQAITPDRLLGRVNSGFMVLTTIAALVGTLLGGALGQMVGIRTTLALAIGVSLTASLWLINSPLRTLRATDDAHAAHKSAPA